MANVTDDTSKDTNGNAGADDALDPKIGNAINAAVSSHLKRHMKGLGDQFGTMLDERLAALSQKKETPAPAVEKPAADPMQEVEKLRGELKAQKMRAAEKEVYADIRSHLTNKVRPEAMDMAIKVLKADGLVKIDSRDGTATFKSQDLGDVELAEGLEEWLKGEGAIFAPTAQAKKPRVTGPARAPIRPGPGAVGQEENLTPAQKTARALHAKGFTLI